MVVSVELGDGCRAPDLSQGTVGEQFNERQSPRRRLVPTTTDDDGDDDDDDKDQDDAARDNSQVRILVLDQVESRRRPRGPANLDSRSGRISVSAHRTHRAQLVLARIRPREEWKLQHRGRKTPVKCAEV